MKLAMTSIAVTASICASASEAALLVASFMSNSLDVGAIHRGAAKHISALARSDDRIGYSEHPATMVRPKMSPHSGEYRRSHGRTVLRRDFDSAAAGICARDGTFGRKIGLKLARPLEVIELAGDVAGLGDRIGTEGAGAGECRRTIGKIR